MSQPIQSVYVEGNDAASLREHWNTYLQMTSYSDPHWVGDLGRMAQIAIVGQRHVGWEVPAVLEGNIELRKQPDNEKDPRAISVYYMGRRMGYVRKVQTELLHEFWDRINMGDPNQNSVSLLSTAEGTHCYLIDLPATKPVYEAAN